MKGSLFSHCESLGPIYMGKPSAVGQLTRPTKPFIILGSAEIRWLLSLHWRRRLVNAYEVKADMVNLQCNNCVIHLSASETSFSQLGAIQIQLPLPFYYCGNRRRGMETQFCLLDDVVALSGKDKQWRKQ